MTDSLQDLAEQLDRFARDRDWNQFHSPKNLASALIVEAGELLEHFQWMTEDQSRGLAPAKVEAIGAELADVLLYLIQLSTALGIDPVAAAQAKLQVNELKQVKELIRSARCTVFFVDRNSASFCAMAGLLGPMVLAHLLKPRSTFFSMPP